MMIFQPTACLTGGTMFKKKVKAQATSKQRFPLLEFSEIEKATNNFDPLLMLGQGALADVYKAPVSDAKIHVLAAVIKRLNDIATVDAPESWPELDSLSTFRHPNLASLIGYCNIVKHYYNCSHRRHKEIILVYQYFPNGSLKDHLHVRKTPLSWITRLTICISVARALNYLHTRTTKTHTASMHGHLKTSNIFLTESWTPKVSDFGLAKFGPSDGRLALGARVAGCVGYCDAYTLTMTGQVTKKSDVYSLGVVLLEVLCRRHVVDRDQPLLRWVRDSVKEGRLEDIVDPDIKNEVSLKSLKDFYEITERCLCEPQEERPDMAEVLTALESVLRDPSNYKENTKFPKVLAADSQSLKEFTFDDLEKATRGFSKPLIISDDEQGAGGNVFLGWVEQNTLAPSEEGVGTAVAVKQITSELLSQDEWLEEVNFLRHLNHPSIIRPLGFCIKDENKRLVVYEHMNKSLSKLIHGDNPFPWKNRVEVMKRVAQGLKYLCKNVGVICHFYSNDVLLNEKFEAKIGRFGWMEVWETHDGKQLNGTFGYLNAGDHGCSPTKNDDVFNFGLVLLETLTGKHPSAFEQVFLGLESLEMESPKSKLNKRKIRKMMDPRLKKNDYSLEEAFKCLTLASRCTAIEPEYRPSREEISSSLEGI